MNFKTTYDNNYYKINKNLYKYVCILQILNLINMHFFTKDF